MSAASSSGDALHRRLRDALAAVLLVLVAGHFAVTAVYVSPPNPLKMKVIRSVHAYMNPLFGQAWTLFAPNPTVQSVYLATRCKWRSPDGAEHVTEAHELSSGWYERTRTHRIGPGMWMRRAISGPLIALHQQRDALTTSLLNLSDHDNEELRRIAHMTDAADASGREDAMRRVVRAASAECDRLYPAHDMVAILPMMLIESPPPFSKRTKPDVKPEVRVVEYGWKEHVEVTPYGRPERG